MYLTNALIVYHAEPQRRQKQHKIQVRFGWHNETSYLSVHEWKELNVGLNRALAHTHTNKSDNSSQAGKEYAVIIPRWTINQNQEHHQNKRRGENESCGLQMMRIVRFLFHLLFLLFLILLLLLLLFVLPLSISILRWPLVCAHSSIAKPRQTKGNDKVCRFPTVSDFDMQFKSSAEPTRAEQSRADPSTQR